MKKILALILAFVVLLSVCVIGANAENSAIEKEIINLIVKENLKYNIITPEDVHISYCLKLDDDKYIVRHSESCYAYSCDVVEIPLGNYNLIVHQRPIPEIYFGGVLYDIEHAYEQGIINDNDLHTMSTFDEIVDMTINKISDKQQGTIHYSENPEPVLFEDAFVKKYEERIREAEYNGEDYGYYEHYYHYDENGEIDWCLIDADFATFATCDIKLMRLDSIILVRTSGYQPFAMNCAVYDVKTDEIIDIVGNYEKLQKYEGLEEAIAQVYPTQIIGDCDLDGKISILDATAIQMKLATGLGMGTCKKYEDIHGDPCQLADLDGDEKVTILDATAIQFKLAKLDIPVATPDKA